MQHRTQTVIALDNLTRIEGDTTAGSLVGLHRPPDRRNRRPVGFTLIELLVVIATIALLIPIPIILCARHREHGRPIE